MNQVNTDKISAVPECMKQECAKRETKRKIVAAFWTLYKKTRIEKITVKKITDACGIYRTTFYLHFADVYAILEEIEEQLMGELKALTTELNASDQDRRVLVQDIHAMLKRNCDYLQILLDGRHHPEFTELYKSELMKCLSVVYRFEMNALDEKSQMIIRMTFFNMIDLLLQLVDVPYLMFEDVVAILDGYMENGVVKTLGNIFKKC